MNATRQEVYVSVDIEVDGPIPGPHSMLSLASAAFLPDKTLVSTFSVNLEILPGAGADPRTMEWWEQLPEAWQASRSDPQPPVTAMRAYVEWLATLPASPRTAAVRRKRHRQPFLCDGHAQGAFLQNRQELPAETLVRGPSSYSRGARRCAGARGDVL